MNSHDEAEAIVKRIAPPAADALRRRADREGTTLLQIVQDALYRAAADAILSEYPEMVSGERRLS